MVNGKFISCEIVQMMKEMLNRVDRGNIKNLALSAKKNAADFKSEQERICAHHIEKNHYIIFNVRNLKFIKKTLT